MKKLFKTLAFAAGAAGALYAGYVAVTFRRYGRPNVKGVPDPLLDQFMPDYEVRDYHTIRVDAPPEITMHFARGMRLDRAAMTRFLFALRTLPAKLQGTRIVPFESKGLEEDSRALGWQVLADIPDRHLILGCATRPWQANVVFEAIPPDEFHAFTTPDYAKIAWAIRVEAIAPETSLLTIETRVATTSADARRKFRRYWSFLAPGIKAIRYEMLEIVKKVAEHQAHKAA
jgi:hypothetical protein